MTITQKQDKIGHVFILAFSPSLILNSTLKWPVPINGHAI